MFEKGLEHWARKELAFTQKKLRIRDSLSAVETAAGIALLGDDKEGDVITAGSESLEEVERAHAQLRALDVAIAGCRSRRLAAIQAKRAATVSALRKEMADKEGELSALDSKTRELLEEISRLQGVQYSPAILSTTPQMGQWGIPRSAQLRSEIGDLERRALLIEQAAIPRGGVVDSNGTLDDLAIAALEHESDGPTAEQVLQWADDVERIAGSQGRTFGDHPRRYRLVFADREINQAESTVFVPALARPIRGTTIGTEIAGWDIVGATFRAVALPKEGRFA